MSSVSFKDVVFYIQVLVNLIWVRNFGKVIFDTSKHHDGKVSIKQLRNLGKNHTKLDKAILNLNFLLNSNKLGVVPKFLCFNLPYTNHNDSKAIRRRLLRSAIRKRTNEKYKLTKDLQESTKDVKSVVTGIEWLALEKSILMNVKKKRTSIIKAHEKKLKNLSKNFTLPFTSDEVITNLSNYQLSDTERDLLKYGLSYAIPPRSINKTDIFTTFEKLNPYLCTKLKNTEDTEMLRAELSQLANLCYSK